jgi:hypothetical protein
MDVQVANFYVRQLADDDLAVAADGAFCENYAVKPSIRESARFGKPWWVPVGVPPPLRAAPG